MTTRSALAAAALALAACSPDFDPASKIDKLRVLAITAAPPEIAPPSVDPDLAHTAALTSLVLRADFDAEAALTTTIVHLACVPTPGDPAPSPCELLAGAGTTCPMGDMAARFAELWSSREHVLSTKRIQIRGPDAPDAPNQNPVIAGIEAGSADLTAPAVVVAVVRDLRGGVAWTVRKVNVAP